MTEPAELLHCRFREACGLEPCTRSVRVVSWLKKHQEQFASVVEPDVRVVPPLVLDLGVESEIAHNPEEPPAPEQALEFILAAAKRSGASIGLGRYNEPRLVYSTEKFVDASGERRTVAPRN